MVARQQIYRKLSVLFYEKDRELVEELEKLSIEREDSMSKIVKQLISKELEHIKKDEWFHPFFIYKQVISNRSAINLSKIPPANQYIGFTTFLFCYSYFAQQVGIYSDKLHKI